MDEAHTSTSPFYTVHANLPIRKAGALRKEGRTGSSRLFTLQRCNCGTVTLCQRYGGDVSRKRKKKKRHKTPKEQFYRYSERDPSENSIAQSGWLARRTTSHA